MKTDSWIFTEGMTVPRVGEKFLIRREKYSGRVVSVKRVKGGFRVEVSR